MNRLFFGIAVILQPTASWSQDNRDPVAIVERLISAACVVVPVSGTSSSFKIEGDADARISGVLDWLADGGLSGASEYNVEQYEGYMQSEVGARADIEQKCRLQIYSDFAPTIVSWISASSSTAVTGDGNVVIQGNNNNVGGTGN
jgi:hypothetical protein